MRSSPNSWWIVLFFVLLSVFSMIQIPIAWLYAKAAPGQNLLSQIQGNIFAGSVQVNHAQAAASNIQWHVTPSSFLKALVGAKFSASDVPNAGTDLAGHVSTRGRNIINLAASGSISAEKLSAFTPFQWNKGKLTLEDIEAKWSKSNSFTVFKGNAVWRGQSISMTANNQTISLPLDYVAADLSIVKNQATITARNQNKQLLFIVSLTPNGTIKTDVTQRAMQMIPSYQGVSSPDSIVISSVQKLKE